VTVFFTTHVMEEAEYICDRIAIIDHGRILALDTIDNVKKKFGKISVIQLNIKEDISSLVRKLEKLSGIEKMILPQQKDEPLRVYSQNVEDALPNIIDLTISLGLHITDLRVKEPSLEDVFIQIVDSKGESKA
jgi:ABC-2 type transport system ATP-binding protein